MGDNSKNLQKPMAKARGLGSARYGTHHVVQQRALAIALLLGFIYAFTNLIFTTNLSYSSLHEWFNNPFNAAVMAIIIISASGHFRLGVQIVIEDYIHTKSTKLTLMLGSTMLAALMAAFGVFIIIKLFLGA